MQEKCGAFGDTLNLTFVEMLLAATLRATD